MSIDYKRAKFFKDDKEAALASLAGDDKRWWAEDDPELLCRRVVDTAKSIEDSQTDRGQANLRHARLYENVDLAGITGSDFATSVIQQTITGAGLVSHNVVAACVDTLAAKIAKNRPRPRFLTSGGSWDQQIRARNLDYFMRGLFYETKVHKKSTQVFVDGCIFGTGALHVYQAHDGRLDVERVMPDELFVDHMDGLHGAPRQLFRRKFVHRDVLSAMFPKQKDNIFLADEEESATAPSEARPDMIEVWEAWHLPSKPGAKDGKHVIAISTATLHEEKWKLDCFPFVFFRFKPRVAGFWGKGVAEALTGIQVEINRLVRSISEQIRRRGRARLFIPIGSKISPENITNRIGDIVYFTGQPPVVDNGNVVAGEEFMQLDRLYQKAFQEVGLSELSVSAKKPSGLDAAVALREYSDIESERFALVHQAWEQFHLDFAELALELIRSQIGSGGYKVKTPAGRYFVEADLDGTDLDKSSYVMQMFPVSSLPQYPSARYQRVKEMMADGFIDKAVAQRLLEFPDIEAEQNIANAVLDDADATISAILDSANPEILPLEPYQNLDTIISRATAAYLYARHHGCPEERLQMLRTLIDTATATKADLLAPQPQMSPNLPPPEPQLQEQPAQLPPAVMG